MSNLAAKHQTLRAFFARLHARIGDFWWYTALLFCAGRIADCMNVFVGLWLVPKYVDPTELGAVMPLTQFAGFLALPVGIFAVTFRNEITELAVRGEFGKLKTLIRGSFVATGIFLLLAVLVSYFILPAYLERMRIVNGSLGILIIAYSFINAVAPIFGNPIQALKKFRASTIIGIIGAPVRLLTMLVTLPLRALSGYFVGQASVPAFSIVTSVIALRKELSVKAEPYWNREVFRRVARFALLSLLNSITVSCWTIVSMTVLRQRLPELDSSAYYMTSRFSEIAGFLSTTLLFTMFPFTARLAREGKSTNGIVLKSAAAMVIFGGALAVFFILFGRPILALLPHGADYAAFAWAIPWQIAITVICAIASMYTTAEASASRFGYLVWMAPLSVLFAGAMLAVTGCGYFTPYLPASWNAFLAAHNIRTLSDFLTWVTVFECVRLVFAFASMSRTARIYGRVRAPREPRANLILHGG